MRYLIVPLHVHVDTTGNSLAMKSRVFEISAHRTHMPHRQGVTPSRRLPTIYADTYEY